MMARSIAFLACMALVSGDAKVPIGEASCGNCRPDKDGFFRCNTGGSEDKMPYSRYQPDGKDPRTQRTNDFTFHGESTATAKNITEIGADLEAAGKSIDMLFCGDYIKQFRKGTAVPLELRTAAAGDGAVCVRAATVEAYMQADNEAKMHFEMFGTTNGYASSFAVSKGNPFPESFNLWGSGGLGDVPMNWCGTYMKYMLCSIAFPQVTAFGTDLIPDDYTAIGKIRPVELDSCESMLRVCNRREATDDEQKDDYKPSELSKDGQTFTFAATQLGAEGRKMKNNAWCELWSEGFGLAQAGTGVADDKETVQFESASMATTSTLVTLVLLVLQLLL